MAFGWLLARLGRVARFLWSGWAGLAGFAVLAALWQAGSEAYGAFILPTPAATLASMADLLAEPATWTLIGRTAARALLGFGVAATLGGGLGAVAGFSPATMRLSRPLVTLLLGVPPIAWIVLLMIWFGMGDGTVAATAAIASLPLVFVGTAEGVLGRDRGLEDMARALGVGPLGRLVRIALRQMIATLFPALAMALGTAFKAAIMAELLANAGGIGGELALARATLDIPATLAWILMSVAVLLALEYGVLHPVRAECEAWREAARPWGVRR
jgi:NitT/TauT family transport system permease protein